MDSLGTKTILQSKIFNFLLFEAVKGIVHAAADGSNEQTEDDERIYDDECNVEARCNNGLPAGPPALRFREVSVWRFNPLISLPEV